MIQKGIDIVLKINGKPVAGQQGATLTRSMSPIDITNQITGDWNESLGGLRTWRINCNGLFVVNTESLQALEDAFMNNTEIEASIIINGKNYFGRVLITDYPLSAIFNAQFKYSISLLGVCELAYEDA